MGKNRMRAFPITKPRELATGLALLLSLMMLATTPADCQAQQRQRGLFRGMRGNTVQFHGDRYNRQSMTSAEVYGDPSANPASPPPVIEEATRPGQQFSAAQQPVIQQGPVVTTYNWRRDPGCYEAYPNYPKYIGGFHSSHFNNLGVPAGDIGFRGNGILWTPW